MVIVLRPVHKRKQIGLLTPLETWHLAMAGNDEIRHDPDLPLQLRKGNKFNLTTFTEPMVTFALPQGWIPHLVVAFALPQGWIPLLVVAFTLPQGWIPLLVVAFTLPQGWIPLLVVAFALHPIDMPKRPFKDHKRYPSVGWSISDGPYGLVEAGSQEANTKRTPRPPGLNQLSRFCCQFVCSTKAQVSL